MARTSDGGKREFLEDSPGASSLLLLKPFGGFSARLLELVSQGR